MIKKQRKNQANLRSTLFIFQIIVDSSYDKVNFSHREKEFKTAEGIKDD